MKKGISPLISTVLLILISVSAIYLGLNIIKPTVDMAYEQAAMNEAEQNMDILDNLIREVASEGIGSLRTLFLKVSDGNYRIISNSGNFTGALQYRLDLKHSSLTAPMIKKVGNLKFTAGMNSIGLVGYWKFDEGIDEIANDSSGYGNEGILFSGSSICGNPPTANCPEWVDGKYGRALRFDGIDDYVNISNSSFFNLIPTKNMTIEAWIYPRSFGGNKLGRIVSKETGTTANPYALELEDDAIASNAITFCIGNGTLEACTDTGYENIITLNTWQHVAGRYNRTHITLFVNGEAKRNKVLSDYNFPSSTAYLLIGNNPTNTRQFNGTIDEVRIYSRDLSEEEIKENYEAKASNYQVVLEYSKILLVGPFRIGKGTHKICVEKIGELNNKPLIKIMTC